MKNKIKVQGEVIKVLPNCEFVVECNMGRLGRTGLMRVKTYLCGKMWKSKIYIEKGDIVTVEISPYDLSRGRIVKRR